MSKQEQTVHLYYSPQQFPCGENSTCCGPVGQGVEELNGYVDALKQSLPSISVELVDVSEMDGTKTDHAGTAVIKLVKSFGNQACPVFVFAGDVLSMGPPNMPAVIQEICKRNTATT